MDNTTKFQLNTAESQGSLALRRVLSVSELIGSARLLIERNLPLAWVAGEISNFTRAASGHCYFVLKDARAQVRCVCFRSKAAMAGFALRDGLQVEVRATPTLYEARGEFQLNVDALRLAGAGALYERFAQLKAKLEARGWFAAERKRKLPSFPRTIGIVTSPHAAALSDVLTTLRRRSPHVAIVIYPCAVQGRGGAHEIARAIRTANRRRDQDRIDALIVCRGGGSIEDLWSFNEEVVALAIIDSELPLISGVGHETDFTICDFVADVRAPTPTGAAQLVARARDELGTMVRSRFLHARAALNRLLEREMQRVDYLARRLQHPAARIAEQQRRLSHCGERLRRCARAHLKRDRRIVDNLSARLLRRIGTPLPQQRALAAVRLGWAQGAGRNWVVRERRLERLALALKHLNPESVLERGYSIVTADDGVVVTDSGALEVGEPLRVRFARGRAEVSVTATEPGKT
jgi:exodeoxyribonuclease VII large subunit